MTRPRVLHPADYRRVPWRNGLGSTLEIATDAAVPGGAWTWRLSFADAPARAPFSPFPGIDRHIAVLEGEGLMLEHTHRRVAVPREGPAHAFAGEDAIVGEPIGSGVRDANLMLDRSRRRGSLEVLRATAPTPVALDGHLVLIHVAACREPLECGGDGESLAIPRDSTLVRGGGVSFVADACTLVIARITRIGSSS